MIPYKTKDMFWFANQDVRADSPPPTFGVIGLICDYLIFRQPVVTLNIVLFQIV